MKIGLKLSSMQILVIGFALFIIIGSLLLSLPFASRDGQSIPFFKQPFHLNVGDLCNRPCRI